MSIMPCYSDERSVENELGGKWEEFYEYTFTDSHAEGFEFPYDLDGSPLNLNGIKIVATAQTSGNSTIVFKVNNISMIDMTTGFGNNAIVFLVKNGHSLGLWRANGYEATLTNLHSTLRMLTTEIDSIHNFVFSSTTNVTGLKLKFYVLRGV